MSESVKVPYEGKSTDKAVLLLAAAEELGLDPSVVRNTNGAFVVPPEVAEKAFGKRSEKKEPDEPAKKAPAKKSTSTTKTQE